jgi:GntR family transcriptional regulator
MISIDRSSSKRVTEQLVSQLRYRLASGQYRIGEVMPSTRVLGKQIGVSFHSVRKAYQILEQEGLMESRYGAGYVVAGRAPLGKADRIEQGAALVREALEQLIGLGLDTGEIEYLVQEQLDQVESPAGKSKVLFAGMCLELANLCAQQISFLLQQPVEGVELNNVQRHQDADYIITSFESVRIALERSSRSEVIGTGTYLRPEALEHVSRLLSHQTVGIVTKRADTIPVLTAQLRQQSDFPGQILAASIEQSTARLDEFAHQIDLLLYTPDCRRRLLSILAWKQPNTSLAPVISPESLARIRSGIIS